VKVKGLEQPLSNRRVIGDAGAFLGANWVGQVVGMVRSFTVARLLAPERFGLLQLALLVFEYGRSAHGGLLFGMTKEASQAVGAGDETRLHRTKDSAFTGTLVLGAVALLGVPLYGWLRPAASSEIRLAVAAGLLIALAGQTHTFYVALLRAQRKVPAASATLILFQVLYAVLAIAAAKFWGVEGIYLGMAVSYVAVAALAWHLSEWRFHLALRWGDLRRLFRRGVPVLGVTFLFRLISSLDKILVTHFYGIAGLGIYGLAKRAGGLAGGAAESIRWVTLPAFLEDVGRRADPEVQRARVLTLLEGMCFVLPPLLATAALLCHLPLEWFLPKYVAAAGPARVLLLGAGFLALAGVPRSLLVALDRELWLMAIQGGMIAVMVTLMSVVHAAGGGLVGTAQASVATQALYAAAVLALALRATGLVGGDLLRSVSRLFAPQCAAVAALILVGWWSAGGGVEALFGRVPWEWAWPRGVAASLTAAAAVWGATLGVAAWLGMLGGVRRGLGGHGREVQAVSAAESGKPAWGPVAIGADASAVGAGCESRTVIETAEQPAAAETVAKTTAVEAVS
jgi:O-antigen/teichoic acid export membrane protein